MREVKPSESTVGLAWLENFPARRQKQAVALIDGLRIATGTEVSGRLRARVLELLASRRICAPVLLLPEASANKLKKARNELKNAPDAESRPSWEVPLVLEDNLDPTTRIDATPGSEGIVGNAIRSLVRGAQRGTFFSPQCKPKGGLGCVRTVLVLADNSGSGSQLWKYGAMVDRNETIRERRASGRLKVWSLIFAATDRALSHLHQEGSPFDCVQRIERNPTIEDREWTPWEAAEMKELCLEQARGGKDALGFGETAALFATEFSVPNTLPKVFWQDPSGWSPLFKGLQIPPEFMKQVGSYRPGVSEVPEFGHSGFAFPRAESMRLAAVLEKIGQGSKDSETIADRLGWNPDTVRPLVAHSETMGLLQKGLLGQIYPLDSDWALTEDGWRFVESAFRPRERPEPYAVVPEQMHYPGSLRGGRSPA